MDVTSPEPTSWTLHLAARRPARAIAAILLIVFALFGVAALLPAGWDTVGKAVMLLLASLLLFASIAEFLLPVTYTLDAEGAHARLWGSHRVLPWNRVRRVYLQRDGIKLSPLTTRGWAESYRGVFLRTPRREAVLEQVRAWLEAAGASPEISDEHCEDSL